MALVTDPYTFVGGATAVASQVNSRIAAILAQLNGNVDATNLAAGGVSKAKLATDALQAFLQLGTPATRRLAYGRNIPGVGFGGGNRQQFSIAHGLGTTPLFWLVQGGPVGAASTSTGQKESVNAEKASEDATNLVVQCNLSNGATAAVGPPYLDWLAIY
jgi:hypothetical protein